MWEEAEHFSEGLCGFCADTEAQMSKRGIQIGAIGFLT